MTSGELNIDLNEKLTEIVSKWFLRNFRTLFPFLATTPRSRVRREASRPPPPRPTTEVSAPARRGLMQIYLYNVASNTCWKDMCWTMRHHSSPQGSSKPFFGFLEDSERTAALHARVFLSPCLASFPHTSWIFCPPVISGQVTRPGHVTLPHEKFVLLQRLQFLKEKYEILEYQATTSTYKTDISAF